MTEWWTGSAVLLDTETDGPEPTDARVIQGAVINVTPSATSSREWLVKPERDIDQGAIDVHGITTERAQADGEDRESAVRAIAHELAERTRDGRPVVAHNASFDLTLLDREMRRTGVGSLGEDSCQVTIRIDEVQVGAFYVVDTIVLDRAVDQYRKGPPEGGRNKLETACAVYGVPMPAGAAHDATADAFAAGRLAWAIARRCALELPELVKLYADRKYPVSIARDFQALGTLSLPRLHVWQRRQAKEQGEHFQDYFAEHPERGVDPADVRTEWPFIPVTAMTDVAL